MRYGANHLPILSYKKKPITSTRLNLRFCTISSCLQPPQRTKITLGNRLAIASAEVDVGPTCHIPNGDEENSPLFAGQYHKTRPHDKFGQVRGVRELSCCLSEVLSLNTSYALCVHPLDATGLCMHCFFSKL